MAVDSRRVSGGMNVARPFKAGEAAGYKCRVASATPELIGPAQAGATWRVQFDADPALKGRAKLTRRSAATTYCSSLR